MRISETIVVGTFNKIPIGVCCFVWKLVANNFIVMTCTIILKIWCDKWFVLWIQISVIIQITKTGCPCLPTDINSISIRLFQKLLFPSFTKHSVDTTQICRDCWCSDDSVQHKTEVTVIIKINYALPYYGIRRITAVIYSGIHGKIYHGRQLRITCAIIQVHARLHCHHSKTDRSIRHYWNHRNGRSAKEPWTLQDGGSYTLLPPDSNNFTNTILRRHPWWHLSIHSDPHPHRSLPMRWNCRCRRKWLE